MIVSDKFIFEHLQRIHRPWMYINTTESCCLRDIGILCAVVAVVEISIGIHTVAELLHGSCHIICRRAYAVQLTHCYLRHYLSHQLQLIIVEGNKYYPVFHMHITNDFHHRFDDIGVTSLYLNNMDDIIIRICFIRRQEKLL